MRLRRLAGLAVVAVVTGTALSTLSGNAGAAPTPWRFTTISVTENVAAGADADLWGQCPAGYFPVTGGIESEGRNFQLYYEQTDPQNDWFTTSIHAFDGGAYTMHADCLDDDAVGFVYQPSHTFKVDSYGVAGGVVQCPDDQQVVGGSAYWTKAGDREVDYFSPYGNTSGGNWWFAKGRSSVPGNALVVTADCLSKADMASATLVVHAAAVDAQGRVDSLTGCPSDMRILTGGNYTLTAVGPYPLGGRVLDSYPENPRLWETSAIGLAAIFDDVYTNLWCVPASVPTVQITSAPPALSNQATARFTYAASDPAGYTLTALCELDGGPAQTCNNPGPGLPVTYTGLSNGTHTFTVIVSNPDGQAALASDTWRVDTGAPVVALTQPFAPVTINGTTTVAWTGSDNPGGSGIVHYQVREQSAGLTGAFSAWTVPAAWSALSPSTTHLTAAIPIGRTVCFSARAIDNAGLASAWTAARCAASPLDDRSLTPMNPGWTRHTAAGYYQNSYTSSTTSGATLGRSGAIFDRVALVATHCPTCGSVAVYDGSTLLGVVNLHAMTRTLHVLTLLPVRPLHTGTVKIVVHGGGKPVEIDGLALSRK